MTTTDPGDLELVRKASRDLARRFSMEYWRDKDKQGEYPWEFYISGKVLGLPKSY